MLARFMRIFDRNVVLGIALTVCPFGSTPSIAADAGELSIRDAVLHAREAHPAIEVARARTDAAVDSIRLARLAYRPRADVHLQEVRSTRNNISGLVLPQPVLPQVSGPVLPSSSGTDRFGSALGGLVSWEPFDFGLRNARTELAAAEARQSRAGIDTAGLDISSTAAEAFLAALAADETVRAARANVRRMETFARTVHSLASSQLRPGADAARADAELARARTQLAQAEQASEVARAALAEAAALPTVPADLDPGRLLEPAAGPATDHPGDPASHPQARQQAAAVEAARARRHVVDTSAMPKLQLTGATFSRGSGFEPDGRPSSDGDRGLLPTVGNWAVGASVSYPLHERAERRARLRVESANVRAESARLAQVTLAVTSQQRQADALLRGARRIAEQAVTQLASAREAQAQARSRFDSGLASVTEVAEADLLLARAEADEAVARVGVWRGLLAVARARGDVDGWLALATGRSAGPAAAAPAESRSH